LFCPVCSYRPCNGLISPRSPTDCV
jgi:hypothetical protein